MYSKCDRARWVTEFIGIGGMHDKQKRRISRPKPSSSGGKSTLTSFSDRDILIKNEVRRMQNEVGKTCCGDDTGRDAMPMQKFGHFIFPLQRVPIADLQKRALPARDEECPRLFGAAAVKDFCPTAGWTAAGFPHRGKFRFGPYRAASLLVLPAAGTHQPPEPTNRLPFCWKKSFMLRRICACMARRAASAFPSRIASRMCWCSGMDCLA